MSGSIGSFQIRGTGRTAATQSPSAVEVRNVRQAKSERDRLTQVCSSPGRQATPS